MNISNRELMPVIRASLNRGQHVRMTANGNSMLPFLHDGDAIELVPAPIPRLGDVVLVQTSTPGTAERYLLHRIVRLEKGIFFIRGDAQTFLEGPFGPDALLGRVTTAWHQGRTRRLDRGFWHRAGFLWFCLSPLGTMLLRLFLYIRRIGSRFSGGLKPGGNNQAE